MKDIKFKKARKKQKNEKFLEYLNDIKKYKKNKKLLIFCKSEKFLFWYGNSFLLYNKAKGKSIKGAILLNKDIIILWNKKVNMFVWEKERNENIKFITDKIQIDRE